MKIRELLYNKSKNSNLNNENLVQLIAPCYTTHNPIFVEFKFKQTIIINYKRSV